MYLSSKRTQFEMTSKMVENNTQNNGAIPLERGRISPLGNVSTKYLSQLKSYSSGENDDRYNNMLECLTTHWGRVTHICVSKLTVIGSDNGLSPDQRQATMLEYC